MTERECVPQVGMVKCFVCTLLGLVPHPYKVVYATVKYRPPHIKVVVLFSSFLSDHYDIQPSG